MPKLTAPNTPPYPVSHRSTSHVCDHLSKPMGIVALGDEQETGFSPGRVLAGAAVLEPCAQRGHAEAIGTARCHGGGLAPVIGSRTTLGSVWLALLGSAAACHFRSPRLAVLVCCLLVGTVFWSIRRSRYVLSPEANQQIAQFFEDMELAKLDTEELLSYWKTRCPRIRMSGLFRDASGAGIATLTVSTFMSSWRLVKDAGYTDSEILTELNVMRAYIKSLHVFKLRKPLVRCPVTGARGHAG
uniref:Uncharacterized protein n=1 Tax=Pyrodinium bahamense TaxID=73915 RepID=A0A7S0A5C5_9DINO|mmetsp:Transcript_2339/g.6693  ORF Transcript_2339/g.6693 Transcript_2339/m.6693 type:complete len:243 (+) Transcript_2339:26-754(+)